MIAVLLMVSLAAGVSGLSGLGFRWALLIVVCAFGINGLVATLEDDLPGGFNNPDGNYGCRHQAAQSGRWNYLG